MNNLIALILFLSSTFAFAGNVQNLRTDGNGNITASVRGEETKVLPSSSQGRYTPIGVTGTNASAVTTFESTYIRVGKAIFLGIAINLDPLAASTLTEVTLTLPPGYTTSGNNKVTGVGNGFVGHSTCGVTEGSTAAGNDLVKFRCIPSSTANQTIYSSIMVTID